MPFDSQLLDDAADFFMTRSIWENQHKPWVRNMAIPSVCVFGIALLASLGTMAQKIRLFIASHSAHAMANDAAIPVSIGGVEVSADLAQRPALRELKTKFDENQFDMHRIGCTLVLALLEGALVSQSVFEHLKGFRPFPLSGQRRLVCRCAHGNALRVLSLLFHPGVHYVRE